MNLKKSVLFTLKERDESVVNVLLLKKSVTYFDVFIYKNKKLQSDLTTDHSGTK